MANIFFDFTNKELEKQFMMFSNKLRQNIDFKTFIRSTCVEIESTYYLYLPDFKREIVDNPRLSWLRQIQNVVIYSNATNYYLPDGLTFMMLGNIEIIYKTYFKYHVNSIQLIDMLCRPQYGMFVPVTASAVNAFTNAFFTKGSEYEKYEWNDTAINMDVIERLLTRTEPVTQFGFAKENIAKWDEYNKFREYYTENAKSLGFHIDKCEIVNAYMINKEDLGLDIDNAPFLDNHNEFGKVKSDELVFLSESVSNADPCRIMKLSIVENVNDVDPQKDKSLNRLLRNPLKLTNGNDSSSENNPKNNQKDNELRLGNGAEIKINLIRTEIPPDYSDIEKKFETDLKSKKAAINKEYKDKLENKVKEFKKDKDKELEAELKTEFEKRCSDIDSTLSVDIKENNDPEIRSQIEKEAKNIAKQKKIGIEEAKQSIDVAAKYRDRNDKKKKDIEAQLRREKDKRLDNLVKEMRSYEEARLNKLKEDSIVKEEEQLREAVELKKSELNKVQTKRLTEIYLNIEGISIKDNRNEDSSQELKYDELLYDPHMESIRNNRLAKSLDNFRSGRVANPMLAQYIYDPKTLPSINTTLTDDDVDWENKRLNDSQREAVRKALCASGLFLIQGPPGTGKTTVIAEITAQFVKRNMRVLIASETHKAVDNAFEDIEELHMPQVRMLRISPKQGTENNKWSREKLTDNFYRSIINSLERLTDEYNNFDKAKGDFDKEMRRLRKKCKDISDQKADAEKIREQIENETKKANEITDRISVINSEYKGLKDQKGQIEKTINRIERLELNIYDDEEDKELTDFRNELYKLQDSDEYSVFRKDSFAKIVGADIEEIQNNVNKLSRPDELTQINLRIKDLKDKMASCKDDSDDVLPEKKTEYENLKKVLIIEANKKNALLKETSGSPSLSLPIMNIIQNDILGKIDILAKVPQMLGAYQKEIDDLKNKHLDTLSPRKCEVEAEINSKDEERNAQKKCLEDANKKLEALKSNDVLSKVRDAEKEMIKAVEKFFTDFNVNSEYPKDDYSAALDIMESEWKKRCDEFKSNESLFQTRNDVLKEIRQYIENGAIARDNEMMMPKLIDHANVIGVTSTGNYDNPEDFNISNINIDVVIVDEVSKSSFLDLLRPMLQGKMVILVGDHMQLPPLYDLKHLRCDEKQNDFDGLDENVINPAKNEEYRKLVETCFFKELYDKVPDSNKVMLDRQYRFHSQIMKLNPFYHGKLKLGDDNLDNRKDHNINMVINGKTIISPDHHICFVDCGDSFESRLENTTSLVNEGEADVVKALLRQIAQHVGAKNNLSVGVICTYGMQAAIIKRKIRNDKSLIDLRNRATERLIVSTVDDFQGDERDIIILSMVRNPRAWKKPGRNYNLDFIKAYERINVAITRPRRLLIIVGAKEFLARKACVDLPDENGKLKPNVPVFQNIISVINKEGHVVFMDDIIDFGKETRKVNNPKQRRIK